MTKREKIAQIIRGITVPPILVTAHIIILAFNRKDIFQSSIEVVLSVLFLGFIPILAYPLQPLLPHFKNKGREGQRNLAFILNIIGYVMIVIIGYFMNVSMNLQTIYLTYFFSVIVLTLFNKVIQVRASGHACAVAGPFLLLIYFQGLKVVIPCVIIAVAVAWSSLELKRHTRQELIIGTMSCCIAFTCALGISLL